MRSMSISGSCVVCVLCDRVCEGVCVCVWCECVVCVYVCGVCGTHILVFLHFDCVQENPV